MKAPSYMVSIPVKQSAITQEAYLYFQILKKNCEEPGSIPATQPTQLSGNIHCINNPSEITPGFFTASSVWQKRIFINKDAITDRSRINTGGSCDRVSRHAGNFLVYDYPDPASGPYYFSSIPNPVVFTKRPSAGCSLSGGITIKPSY